MNVFSVDRTLPDNEIAAILVDMFLEEHPSYTTDDFAFQVFDDTGVRIENAE